MALRIDKINLKATDVAALPVYGLITAGTNLNTLDGRVYGKYWQSRNANSPTSLNYPVAAAGTLLVLKNNASSLSTSCTQIYLPYNSNEIYSRSFYNSWTAWSRFASIDMDGANSTIKSLTGLTTALSIEQGGTGVVSKEAFRQSYNVPTKDESLLTENNLSDLADRAAAWLNVRPIGSTPLAGDPVNDYDAVTKRWVENKINTGTVGPTMNGVMNYGVGDFHLRDSRAYIQPYEVVSDGQLLNRADWPELWAYAQMLTPISDDEWLADKFKRGRYSTGNGTTTFRVPDRNGVQSGSLAALYARGDGAADGTAVSAADGMVFDSAAPNIFGAIGGVIAYGQSGAIVTVQNEMPLAPQPSTGNGVVRVNLDASKCSPVYGRSNTEIMGRNFVGVWVIRASGGFIAANTSWSVINGGAIEPPSGVTAYGGAVRSAYNIAGAEAYVSQLRTKILFGTDFYSALEMKGQGGTLREVMSVNSIGAVTVPGGGGFFVDNTGEPNAIELFNTTPSSAGNTFVNMMRGHWYDDRWEFGGIRDGSNHINHVQLNISRAAGGNKYWAFKWENSCIDTNLGLIQPGGSDRRLKGKITDITNTEGNTPSDRINRLVAREFEWLSDGRKDRGFVAQEAQEADKIYAFSGSISGMMNLNDRAILADVVAVVQEQDRELAEVKAELAELRELVNLMVQK